MGTIATIRTLRWVLGGALVLGPAVWADARASFRAGVQLADKAAWPEAVAAFRQALREDPKESAEPVRIYGMRYEDYRPHLYLARALVRSGDHATARQVLDQLVRQGPQSRLVTSRIRFLYRQCDAALGVRLEAASTGAKTSHGSQSVLVSPGPSPDPLPASCVGNPREVHACALKAAVEEAEKWLAQADGQLEKVEARRRRDPSRFNRDPARAGTLETAKELSSAARFRLAACRLEGDLEGAQTARDDARVAAEELEALWRSL